MRRPEPIQASGGTESRPPWSQVDLLCIAALVALCCLFFHRVLLSPGSMF